MQKKIEKVLIFSKISGIIRKYRISYLESGEAILAAEVEPPRFREVEELLEAVPDLACSAM